VLLVCLGLAGVSGAAAGTSTGDPAAAVVAAAKAHLHDPYAWGGAGPKSWDCSGLTSTLWREVGGVRDVPRTSQLQQAWTVPLPAEQALPGDLVFFGDPATHVGLVQQRITTTKAGTTIQMIDASSSQKGVVQRSVWQSDTVRFGRVPRAGMTPVKPWKPATPTPRPAAAPTATVSAVSPAPVPTAHGPKGSVVLLGFPTVQNVPSSAVAIKAVTLAKGLLGNTTIGDVELIDSVWRRAGGATLPTTREALGKAGRPVALRDARVGDVVAYGPPTAHVGIYLGHGLMVDASRLLGKVVLRQVWASPSLRLIRFAR
jgi:cell wall-associated NlpC family hydrolase